MKFTVRPAAETISLMDVVEVFVSVVVVDVIVVVVVVKIFPKKQK